MRRRLQVKKIVFIGEEMKVKNKFIYQGMARITCVMLFALLVMPAASAWSAEVGWQKVIDDGFNIGDRDPTNWRNCDKICTGCDPLQPAKCATTCRKEFFCAGPWRSYPWPDGEIVGGAYLYLSTYGASQPLHPSQVRKGWALWQWEVQTSGVYKVEVMYRPTHNRSPDADYYIMALKQLGVLDGMTPQKNIEINQRYTGPLSSSGWLTLGSFSYYKGQVAAVGLWAHDDTYSDEADAVRWTLLEKLSDPVQALPGANLLLIGPGQTK